MAHCSGCDNPECQGADHLCEVVIDEDEFRKLLMVIKRGLNNRGSTAAIDNAKAAVVALENFDKH